MSKYNDVVLTVLGDFTFKMDMTAAPNSGSATTTDLIDTENVWIGPGISPSMRKLLDSIMGRRDEPTGYELVLTAKYADGTTETHLKAECGPEGLSMRHG